MSGNISLCSFCRYIPLDVDTLERLRPEARPRSALRGSRNVPLDSSRKTDLIAGDRVVFALGKAERVLGSDCPICKITAIAVRDIKKVLGWHDLKADTPLTLTWSHKGPGSKGVFRVNEQDDVYICFAERYSSDQPRTKLSMSTACIMHPTQAHLDPSSVTRWITDCKRLHGPECNAHNGSAGPVRDIYRGLELMRFVDVHKMCIVECREVVEYVALSYVWGAAPTLRLTTMNQRQMCTTNVLSGLALPNTITDAIDLTRDCGEQYLWVDTLCIMQNDVEDLEAGTYAMDLICKLVSPWDEAAFLNPQNEMSIFTIVAASGSDAGHGLPGYKFGSRLAPVCAEVAPGVRLGVLSEVETLVRESCYATRGWTLQEEMLSKRILYFVDDKIFYHCPGATLSEGCGVTLRWNPNGLLQMLEPLRDYKTLVRLYSKRFLTTQTDAFRAMSGIIRRISENENWYIVEGMPTVALENMMLFRRNFQPLSRRPAFASYSWLGWKGELEFMEGSYFFEGWIDWYVRHPSTGEILPIERPSVPLQERAQMTGTWASNDVATYRKPDFGVFPRAGVQMDQMVPSEKPAKLHPPRAFSLLFFSTLAVFFRLTSIDYVKGKADVSHPDRGTIGKITLDGLDEYPPATDAEFILLSKTSPANHDLEDLGLREYLSSKQIYMIMLIEWFDGVAERRGIGFMDALEGENSMAPGPVWKDITLG